MVLTAITNIKRNIKRFYIFKASGTEQSHGGKHLVNGSFLQRLLSLRIQRDWFGLPTPVPSSLGNASRLEILDLPDNSFSGPVPMNLGMLTRLTRFNLVGNRLGTKEGDDLRFLESLTNCVDLFLLGLEFNNLKGGLPESIANLSTQLAMITMSKNQIFGSIPNGIGNLVGLTELAIDQNLMTGSIPVSIGKLQRLQILDLSRNRFSGSIPYSIGNISLLSELLDGNFLTGRLPNDVGNLKNLEEIDIARNRMSESGSLFNNLDGEVPQEGLFRNLSPSSVFGSKKLCGGIPELQLVACPVVASKKQGKSLVIKFVIAVLAAILCLLILSCLFGICYWRRKPRKRPSSTSSLKNQHFKVSYMELLKATDGFSSSNFIGFGSYGSVYKGVLDHDEMIVAVKVLDLRRKGASKSVMAECNALRNIRHRNLIRVLTSCSSVDSKGDHFKAIVLEFMPNGSLEKWLHPQDKDSSHHSRKLSLIQRLNIAIDVASALEYLHHDCKTPLIHWDLKLSNVLFDVDMIAHVGDFGLARFFCESDHNSQNQTSLSVIKGSIGYVAPGNVSNNFFYFFLDSKF
ncbi:putative receptor-like protein kinase At3g47110 [Magnolia sinica]|uniref:putative receptor-like protein kinase At3g47110 n=1 Tax=Magnolia sinica TaxID=86752 RepID=UPI00265A7C46|nr:putative receptor-like protein kinase At3g47110 [Magnolia sinica]